MYLATLRRQWLLAALVVLTATVVGFVVASAKTPSYEATAQILLDRQDPVDALLGTSAPSPDPERDLNTSVQLVGLQPIASRVGRVSGPPNRRKRCCDASTSPRTATPTSCRSRRVTATRGVPR